MNLQKLKQAEANYYHGKIHGRAQEYHPNGTIRLKMDYAYGNPVSSLEEFDEQGKLVRSSAHPTQPDPKVGQRQGKSAPNPSAGGDQPLRKGAVPAS